MTAAADAFMSLTPRPYIRSPSISAANGSWCHRPLPWSGIVSTWQSVRMTGEPSPKWPTALPASSTRAPSYPRLFISFAMRRTTRSSRPGVESMATSSRRKASRRASERSRLNFVLSCRTSRQESPARLLHVHRLSAQQRIPYHSGQGPAGVGHHRVPVVKPGWIDCKRLVGREDAEVGVEAHLDPAFAAQARELGRFRRHPAGDLADRNSPAASLGPHQGQPQLQRADACPGGAEIAGVE